MIRNTNMSTVRGKGFRPLPRLALSALALSLPLAGCDLDEVLEVERPFDVTVPVAQDPANLPNALAGAFRQFARSYGGVQNNNGGIIHHSGMLADEIWHSGSFPTRREIDRRDIQETNGTLATEYSRLHLARNLSEQVADLYAGSPEAQSSGHAEALNLAGFTYIFFGENFCGAVPFSSLPIGGGETVYGQPNSTGQIFDRAAERFNSALAFASGEQANVARIGLARTLLNQNQVQQAAAAVANVPTNFRYDITYSSAATPTFNAVFQMLNGEKRFSVWGPEAAPAPNYIGEGINGLPYDDPRTPRQGPNVGFDWPVHYSQLKYPNTDADIPLATGIEARLIEAEAALRADNVSLFVSKLNAARQQMGVAALSESEVQAMSSAQRVDLLFRERAYSLWLTAHRLGDLRRLIRQYNRTEDQVFPVGLTPTLEPYGDDVNLRIPFGERNNPNYDPQACSPTAA